MADPWQVMWEARAYAPAVLSAPFALGLVALLVVLAFAVLMRGEPALRALFVLHVAAMCPYALALALAPSIVEPAAAVAWFRLGAAFVPLAAAAGIGFQLVLLGRVHTRRGVILGALGVGVLAVPLVTAGDHVVAGVRRLPGMWFAEAGPAALVLLVVVVVIAALGFVPLVLAWRREAAPARKRHIGGSLLAMATTLASMVDVMLAWGVGVFPVGFLLFALGTLFTMRALWVDDLLRVRSLDTRVPIALALVALTTLAGWLGLALLGDGLGWLVVVGAIVVAYLAARVVVAFALALGRGDRPAEGPLARAASRLASRLAAGRDAAEILTTTSELIELAIGVRPTAIVPSRADWGWQTPAGVRIDDASAPDPLLAPALLGPAGGDGLLLLADLGRVLDDDLTPAAQALFAAHQAEALLAVGDRDELVAILWFPASGRAALSGRARTFLAEITPHVAAALVYARSAAEAAERARLERDLELAGAIQAGFVPPARAFTHGATEVIGSWQPAARVGGDFWDVRALDGQRTLVVVGDVTGHGVAAAMVAAAVRGACEAATTTLPGADPVSLATLVSQLDRAVSRVGQGRRQLTCFAAIVDAGAGEVEFVNAGHVVPYLCQVTAAAPASAARVELSALVARGNPLGSGAEPVRATQRRPLPPGAVVVWYTDGLVENPDGAGQPYGDRRMQRLLRGLDPARLDPASVHAAIVASSSAHHGGAGAIDDVTLVVGGIRTTAAATTP